MTEIRNDCPCKKTACVRHGDCAACREYHKGTPPACERSSRRKERALRRRDRN